MPLFRLSSKCGTWQEQNSKLRVTYLLNISAECHLESILRQECMSVYFNHSDYFTHHCKTCAIVIGWLKATYLLTYLLTCQSWFGTEDQTELTLLNKNVYYCCNCLAMLQIMGMLDWFVSNQWTCFDSLDSMSLGLLVRVDSWYVV